MNSKQITHISIGLTCWLFYIGGCAGTKSARAELVGRLILDGEPVTQANVVLVRATSNSAQKDRVGRYIAKVEEGCFRFPKQQGPLPGDSF